MKNSINKHLIIIMGPSGSGKSTLAGALNESTAWPMVEADDYHPHENIEKQRNGVALTDKDRVIWLDSLTNAISEIESSPIILACSALTDFVQKRLIETGFHCHWFCLLGDRDTIKRRMDARDHFMPSSLLDSQFEALIIPKEATMLDITKPPMALAEIICDSLTHLNEG